VKLRTHLFLLTLATVVPVVLFSAGLILYHARLERATVERGMRDTARALVLALDRDIQDIKTGVETLAASPHLADPVNLPRFYEEAAAVSKSFGGWAVLSEPTGRQVLDTSLPFGATLPAPTRNSFEMTASVAARRETFVSNVFLGTVNRRPAVIIAVPVVRGGTVRYVLDFPFDPTQFTGLLRDAALSPGWIAIITDREGGVVGRVPDPETSSGRKLSPAWTTRTSSLDEGFLRGAVISDGDVYAAFKRSTESGWIVGVAAPAEIVEASFWRSLAALSAGAAALLLIASALAFVLGKRVAAPIVALADSLKTQAPPTAIPGTRVREVEELRLALEEAIERRHLLETEQAARADAERRAVREETANRAKDDFLAVLSHELRTPLNSMLGWVRLLRAGRLDAAKTSHALEVIERNVAQQARLISDLLDVSRIVTGRLRLMMTVVDFPALVNGTVEAMRPAAQAKGITVLSQIDRAAGPVRGDADRLRQVVDNLLTNAVKFTPAAGQIRVQLAQSDGARLIVSDTGKGIDAELLPHIFERFRQGDSTTTRAHAGLGLGLAIVHHLVELHGGAVTAESPGEDAGATFTVSLPLATASDHAVTGRAGSRSVDAAGLLDGLKVLVVEDDADTRDLLATVLAEQGATPMTTANARDGMTTMHRLTPDVLVCDIAMPGDDGYTFISAVRSKPNGPRVPALALTAYARDEDRARALEAGFDLHLSKPVEPKDLVAAVARLAGRDGRNGPA
jgi:signal transduction histidine kinase/ActR/RegA family two-component response regulator